LLSEEEPVPDNALEVLEGGLANEVAIVAVLGPVVDPASTTEWIVLQCDYTGHSKNEVPARLDQGY
jgi:hypothetical protein